MITILFILNTILFSQALDVEKYIEFLNKNQDMSSEQLLNMYPAGEYLQNINSSIDSIKYLDNVINKYNLTEDEISLLKKNGFVVSQRNQFKTYFDAYRSVFKNDFPNYISADLMLYSTHFNFQKILEIIELKSIQNLWKGIVSKMKLSKSEFRIITNSIPVNSYNYKIFSKAYKNFEDYLSITEHLINNTTTNNGKIGQILKFIEDEEYKRIMLFSESSEVPFDFSQFKVRGFYKEAGAGNFFKAMTWLGRAEMVIANGENTVENHEVEDLDVMLLQAVMLSVSIKKDYDNYLKCDNTYNRLIGRQDNITPTEINNILDEMNIDSISMLLDSNLREDFKERILKLSSSKQTYSGNVVINVSPNAKSTLAIVFKVFGQRPILDGYVTSNTTYDNINYKGELIQRWIPSTLDVSFALGNNASAQLLIPELNRYNYSSNLAANRYLFDNNSDSAWGATIYNSWLNILRSLNINEINKRNELPLFAQTAAWNQKNLNTQLASWSQLRRDFILSAKQPYTDSYICSFPKTLLEPNIDFFRKIKLYNLLFKEIVNDLFNNNNYGFERFFNEYITIVDNLIVIAEKQHNNVNLIEEEILFLQNMMIPMSVCQVPSYKDCSSYLYEGWFNQLFYGIEDIYDGTFMGPTFKEDYTVADVHTIPQEGMELVGKVLHAGVGPINLAFILSKDSEGKPTIFTGPVFSYYEYISRDFKRLDEDEWKDFLLSETKKLEPMNFAKYYMSNSNGNKYSSFSNFFLNNISDVKNVNEKFKVNFYPNPAKDKLFISIFPDKINTTYYVEIFDLIGNIIFKDDVFVNSFTNFIIDIDLQIGIKKGIYICKITNDNIDVSFKFLKED